MIIRGPAFSIALILGVAACSNPPATEAQSPAAPQTTAASPASAGTQVAQASPQPKPPSALPPPLAHPLAVGSQEAKDDLYCSGVIFAKYGPSDEPLSPTQEAVRMKNENLGMIIANEGADKLLDEHAVHVTQLGALSDAYADKTAADIKAGKPRLSLETCMAKAKALQAKAQ
ncbi:MAG: hypothetical protein GC155_18850 [Alphaproteobacteria bacterium]|nr:hypothetical protein [Alphaproteobacteria bacterium]